MKEEDFEIEIIVPAVIEPSIQLMQITREANLDPDLANEFRINFEEHFKMANEWSKKAKNIIVTNDNQTVLMSQARVARLFLRSKRLEIENFRKEKKEYYLRGGQAIDKVATFLKNMIEPIENHLDLQEHYIEYKKKAEEERIRLEIEARLESERIAKEKADAEEKERLRIENDKLIKEREERERSNKEELEKVHKENEKVLRIERERNAIVERELLSRKQEELKKEADAIRANEELLKADDSTKLIVFRKSVESIVLPDVKSTINKQLIEKAKSYLYLAVKDIKIIEEEE